MNYRYLFVWLTFIGAIVAFMDNARSRSLLWWKNFRQRIASSLAADAFTDFIVMHRIRLGRPTKALQDWSDHSPILGFTDHFDVICACLPTSVIHRVNRAASLLSLNNA